MRDLLLTGFIVGLIPFILAKPYLGALAWVWIGTMNPHKLTWGFAYHLPFAQMVALATLLGLLFAKDRRAIPWSAPLVLILLFYLWTCLTSFMGIGEPLEDWEQFTKVVLMLYVCLMLLNDPVRIEMLVWVIAISIGYFGFKGGLFTILTGGGERVWGPPGGMVEGNNEIGLALIVVIPLLYFLAQTARDSPLLPFAHAWVKWGLWAAIVCSGAAILGTHSRGAFLGIFGMALLLGMKSKHKIASVIFIVVGMAVGLNFMPEHWWDRMGTIATREDGSSQGRLHAWVMHWNLALDRPIFGGGFDFVTNIDAMYQYDPTGLGHRAAHSIFFQALGDHGFVGLVLYVMIGITTWRMAARLIRQCGCVPDLDRIVQLMRMVQVSLFGFAVGGAFLSLVTWDVPFYLVGIVVLADSVVRRSHPALMTGVRGAGLRHQANARLKHGTGAGAGARAFPQRNNLDR
jgi:putative inorganic carbon (HCO3(-)) transporter